MFLGTHIVGVDAKGRASVPAPFRAALRGEAGVVFVWPSWRGPYLEAGDRELLAQYQTLLAARGAFDDAREDFEYAIFADARALTLDDTGRVSLPEDLRAHAGLGAKAAFAGLTDRFEIWAPERLAARVAEARAKAADKRALLSRPRGPGEGP
ncbi:MAG: division/cell wall cluster transcriptional repressor MraZ [Alphaproteobacteria bacterium]|nr:division/cell wall cluster transcriptional repressor MraZ [Alphaproteobacteria bacterium]